MDSSSTIKQPATIYDSHLNGKYAEGKQCEKIRLIAKRLIGFGVLLTTCPAGAATLLYFTGVSGASTVAIFALPIYLAGIGCAVWGLVLLNNTPKNDLLNQRWNAVLESKFKEALETLPLAEVIDRFGDQCVTPPEFLDAAVKYATDSKDCSEKVNDLTTTLPDAISPCLPSGPLVITDIEGKLVEHLQSPRATAHSRAIIFLLYHSTLNPEIRKEYQKLVSDSTEDDQAADFTAQLSGDSPGKLTIFQNWLKTQLLDQL